MRDPVVPYLGIDPEGVQLGAWIIKRADGSSEALADALPDWDFLTDLAIVRAVRVDPDVVESSCGVKIEDLSLVTSWRATDTKLAGATPRRPLISGDSLLDAKIPGAELGAAIDIYTRVILKSPLESRPGRARIPGSILLSHTHHLALIGDLAQFPVAVVDFAAMGFDELASIVVDIDPDPGAPILAGLQLLINVADNELVSAATSGRSDDGRPDALLSGVDEAVFAQLVEYIALNFELLKSESWDDGSIGKTCCALADQLGGLDYLVTLRETEPTRFQAFVTGRGRLRGLGRQIG